MKRSLVTRKKAVSKIRRPCCEWCGEEMILTDEPPVSFAEKIGPYTLGRMYYRCPKHSYNYLDKEEVDKRAEKVFLARIDELLHEKYPIESNEYLTLDEVAPTYIRERKKEQERDDWDNPPEPVFDQHAIDGLRRRVYSGFFNGELMFLKKSLDRYYDMRYCTGIFNMLDPTKDKPMEIPPDYEE